MHAYTEYNYTKVPIYNYALANLSLAHLPREAQRSLPEPQIAASPSRPALHGDKSIMIAFHFPFSIRSISYTS